METRRKPKGMPGMWWRKKNQGDMVEEWKKRRRIETKDGQVRRREDGNDGPVRAKRTKVKLRTVPGHPAVATIDRCDGGRNQALRRAILRAACTAVSLPPREGKALLRNHRHGPDIRSVLQTLRPSTSNHAMELRSLVRMDCTSMRRPAATNKHGSMLGGPPRYPTPTRRPGWISSVGLNKAYTKGRNDDQVHGGLDRVGSPLLAIGRTESTFRTWCIPPVPVASGSSSARTVGNGSLDGRGAPPGRPVRGGSSWGGCRGDPGGPLLPRDRRWIACRRGGRGTGISPRGSPSRPRLAWGDPRTSAPRNPGPGDPNGSAREGDLSASKDAGDPL